MQQVSLSAMVVWRREAVGLPPKRGPGRPRKVREKEDEEEQDEEPDQVLEALRSQPDRVMAGNNLGTTSNGQKMGRP